MASSARSSGPWLNVTETNSEIGPFDGLVLEDEEGEGYGEGTAQQAHDHEPTALGGSPEAEAGGGRGAREVDDRRTASSCQPLELPGGVFVTRVDHVRDPRAPCRFELCVIDLDDDDFGVEERLRELDSGEPHATRPDDDELVFQPPFRLAERAVGGEARARVGAGQLGRDIPEVEEVAGVRDDDVVRETAIQVRAQRARTVAEVLPVVVAEIAASATDPGEDDAPVADVDVVSLRSRSGDLADDLVPERERQVAHLAHVQLPAAAHLEVALPQV